MDFQRGDVSAERGELFFLEPGNLALRIEDDHAGAGHVVECGGDRAAGVAGGGDEDGELAVFATGEPSHQAGHEARAEVLEGERGAVEKFENVVARAERDERRVEGDGAFDHVHDRLRRDVLAEERIRHGDPDFREGELAPDLPECGVEHGQFVRHVEPVVRRQRAQDRFLEIDAVGRVVSGVV